MKQLWSFLSKKRPGGISRLALVLVGMLALQPTFTMAAQSGFESLPVLSASKILPSELLSGPNHRVQEKVTNDGIVNIYKMDSRFGTFNAVSTAMLRVRIQEINAMAVMDQLKGTKEFGNAVKEAALNTMVAAKSMVFQPGKTVGEAATGVGL